MERSSCTARFAKPLIRKWSILALSLMAVKFAAAASEPGALVHLPFRWHEDPKQTKWHPAAPSPIIALMKQRQAKRDS